jgi:hypothetical protein
VLYFTVLAMHLDLAAWLNIVSTVAIVGALLFTALQVRQGNVKRRDQAAVTLIQTTQSEGWTRAFELIGRLPQDVQVADIDHAGTEVARAIIEFGVRLENVGYLVYRRNVDIETVDDLIGGVTLMFWSRVKDWSIRERKRAGNPKFLEWCEWLANRISERREQRGHKPAEELYADWRE